MMNKIYVFYYIYTSNDLSRQLKTISAVLPQGILLSRPGLRNKNVMVWTQHLIGRFLLMKGLEYLHLDGHLTQSIIFTEHGKPYFEHAPIQFNISHSGNAVICCLSTDSRLGVDIEQVEALDLEPLRISMNELQWKTINSSCYPVKTFLRFWTAKEAVLKAEGGGLSEVMANLLVEHEVVEWNGNTWYLHSLDFDADYVGYIASEQIIGHIILKPVAILNSTGIVCKEPRII